MYAGLWKGKEQIISRTSIKWPTLLKRNEQLSIEQRIEWIQKTAIQKTAMKVVKNTLYRGMFFYCVISMAFTVDSNDIQFVGLGKVLI